jgi:hypothetical protein
VTDRFKDGRRRHVGNSSECYKMGNYRPIFMKLVHRLTHPCRVPKSQKRKCVSIFKMAAATILEIQVRDIKWAIIDQFS